MNPYIYIIAFIALITALGGIFQYGKSVGYDECRLEQKDAADKQRETDGKAVDKLKGETHEREKTVASIKRDLRKIPKTDCMREPVDPARVKRLRDGLSSIRAGSTTD